MLTAFGTEWWRKLATRHPVALWLGQALLLLLAGFVVAWSVRGDSAQQGRIRDAAAEKVSAEPSLWTCSMHPQIRRLKPGDCPICGMDLIPVVTSPGGLRSLVISDEARALMNIRTARVERKYVTHEIPMAGTVDYDETKIGYITAWVAGRLDRLYVDFTGIQVNKGDHMVYIYSEELYAAQEELIQALKYAQEAASRSTRLRTATVDLVESAREKLRLLGLTEEQIKEIEARKTASDHLTIYSPVGGIVVEKLRQEGERVGLGDRIYTIADLNQVWVHLDAYESDLPWIRYGQDVTITTEAYPGEDFHGRIAFIQPVLNDKTRTVKVRVNVPNPDGKLKPDMFVHGVLRPKVAAGGRVMDPRLAGKWLSPMHPEIVKDEPGTCDICGMPLVRAESLGYVTPETDERMPPLVVPYSAALVTGKRAVVYVELPPMPQGVEKAYQAIAAAMEQGTVEEIRRVFALYSDVLDSGYDQSGTDYARQLWHQYAERLAPHALAGQRVATIRQAQEEFAHLEQIMRELREEFAPSGQPTFEGREIVLGPRAGDYYLVRHGLQDGELVVTQGNFKIDSEIQIQAKPSMMTPEGGAGGHAHGGHGGAATAGSQTHRQHEMSLPATFAVQLRNLEAAYRRVAEAVNREDVGQITGAFAEFGRALDRVDESMLSGRARMLWQEFAMLLENDAVEGRDVRQRVEADRVFLLLKGHMRRLRDQLGILPGKSRRIEHIAVAQEFQANLAAVWERYLPIQRELSADEFQKAQQALSALESAVASVDDGPLNAQAAALWNTEKANLLKLIDGLRQADDIMSLRCEFKPFSEEIGVLAKSFGFGLAGPIFELHCPMAFEGVGAVWYQDSEQVRNPYYGSSMLKCADRIERIVHDQPLAPAEHGGHQDPLQH